MYEYPDPAPEPRPPVPRFAWGREALYWVLLLMGLVGAEWLAVSRGGWWIVAFVVVLALEIWCFRLEIR